MDDDLFVVVSWERSQNLTSILQLQRRGIHHEYDPSTQEAPVVESEFAVTFRLPLPLPPLRPQPQWGYALMADSPTEASLHMVPYWYRGASEDELHSCIFNLKTKKVKRVQPPHGHKYGGHVVRLGVHTYFIAHPRRDGKAPNPAFECYDPLKDEWKKLEPIPQDFIKEYISATALWDDTILFNLLDFQFWAYNVNKDKWYRVIVNKPWSCGIEGEAIVIGNTICALSEKAFDLVAVLSINKEEVNNDDLVYKCSLSKFIKVPGEDDIEFDYGKGCKLSRHLLHLGQDKFCLVHSCKFEYLEEYQPIQLTHGKLDIKLSGKKSMTVTNKSVHQFKVEPNEQFEVTHCFSLPKCKTTDLKQGKTSFEFDPFPESFLSRLVVKPVQEEENATLPKDSPLFDVQGATSELDAKSNVVSKESTAVIGHPSHAYEKPSLALKGKTLGVGAAPERSNTDEKGQSICVVKLSSEATVKQLVRTLKTFGPIMKVRIHVPTNATRKPCAYVEFENAAAMRLAIKASPTKIGGRRAVIRNIRRNACEGDLSDMAEAAAVVAPQPLSAQVFGNAFVLQYYHVLHHSPALAHRFYQDTSVLVRPEDNGSLSITTSVNAINEKILSLRPGDCRAELKCVDAQESFRGAVQVFVTGYLMAVTGIDDRIRCFSQCFLLAPHDQGFLVLHDIFRYVESSSQPHEEHVSVDDVVVKVPVSQEQSPVPPAVQESHVSDEGNHVDEVTEGQVLNPPESGDVPVVKEVKVTEVVDEVLDGSLPSYAAIVKRSPFSSQAPVPRKFQETSAGYSIHIKGLPVTATPVMLEKVFKKFGRIRPGGIHICRNLDFCFGFVEFEVPTAVENALKASPIEIGGRMTVVEETRSSYSGGNNKRGRGGRGSFRYEAMRGGGRVGKYRGG